MKKVESISLKKYAEESYLNYAMYVILELHTLHSLNTTLLRIFLGLLTRLFSY